MAAARATSARCSLAQSQVDGFCSPTVLAHMRHSLSIPAQTMKPQTKLAVNKPQTPLAVNAFRPIYNHSNFLEPLLELFFPIQKAPSLLVELLFWQLSLGNVSCLARKSTLTPAKISHAPLRVENQLYSWAQPRALPVNAAGCCV